MPITVLSPCQLLYLWTGKHMWLGKGKNRLPKLWPSINLSAFGKARIQWTLHFHQACPSLLMDAFHWSSISGKRNCNWAWRPARQLFCATSPWGRRACPSPSHSLEKGHSKAKSAQSCLRFFKLISEDTIWKRMHCSFGAVTGNLQPSTKLCDGLPTCQF